MPMRETVAARITKAQGVGSDARGKPGPRQVTVLTRAGWEAACAEIGIGYLPWTMRRANLLVDGIELKGKVGYDLQVGDAVLAITGETRPCERMSQAQPGLRAALEHDWRGGVTCRVVRSGNVANECAVVLRRSVLRQAARIAYLRARRLVKAGRRLASGLARRLGIKRRMPRA